MDDGEVALYIARAQQFVQRFVDPQERPSLMDHVLALRPKPEEYDLVFVGAAIEVARRGYDAQLWSQPVAWPVKPEQTRVEVRGVASTEDLQSGHARARVFPGGYASSAKWFAPGRVWVAWEFLAPAKPAGLFFDGLVSLALANTDAHTADRWAWFPKPWRILGDLVGN